ncbi:MAG: VOC family protein [Vicinamibacteria bacterium]
MPKKRIPKKKARKNVARPKPAAKKNAPKPAPRPSAKRSTPLGISSQHVDFLTYKGTQLQKFYGELLGLRLELRDMDGVEYLVVHTSSSSSLGFMPPHPDIRGEQPAPREPALYFMVDDVDRAYVYLLSKGAHFVRPPETMPWGHRVLTTTDPEGRTVMFAGEAETED